MDKLIKYRMLNISNGVEIANVAEIHENAPKHWKCDHNIEPGQIQKRIEQLKKPEGCIDRFFQVAETNEGRIVGFHWLDIENNNDEIFGHIKSLWVKDEYQHQGIATELKKNGELWAKSKGAHHIKTTVHANNQKMIDFNLHCGYKKGFIEMAKKL